MKLFETKELKNATWIITMRVVQMLLSLFINLLTARYFGPSNYGVINYASSFVAFFTSFCNLGLNYVILKDLIKHKDEQGETIGTSIMMRALSSLLSIVAIWGIVNLTDSGDESTILVVFLCSFAVFFNAFDTFVFWFQIQYNSRVVAVATLIGYVVLSAYRVLLLCFKKDIFWFALASSIDYAIIGLILWTSYQLYKGPHLKVSYKKAKNLISQSYHYIISGMMVTIYGQTDKFMLKHLTTNEELGFYSCSAAICIVWVFVLQAIIDSVFPTIIKLHDEDINAYEGKNKQLYCLVFYISVFVSIVFSLFGEFVIRFLYGEDYLPASYSLMILTWYIAFAYLGVSRNAWLMSENKQKYEKYIYSIAALVNILVNFMLIPSYGASGAALATLITQFLTCLIIPLFFKPLRRNVKLILEAICFKGVF